MKLTSEQRQAMAAALRKGEPRVRIELTPAQKRAYQKAAKEEDANLRRMASADRRGKTEVVSIGESLKAAIQESGLTHYRIAKTAGVSPDVIDRFVSGKRSITLETVDKLGTALGLTLSKARR